MVSRPCLVAPRSDDEDAVVESGVSMSIDEIREQLECLRSLETAYQAQEYDYGDDAPPRMSRVHLVEYLYKIADFGNFQRDTVAYALSNIMDRYLSVTATTATSCSTTQQQQQQLDHQMVALTSLYIATKLLERKCIAVDALVEFADGDYQVADFLDMEQTILKALDWKVGTGPTAISFVQLYLMFLPKGKPCIRRAMMNHVQYQLELALPEYDLMIHSKPSELALAAMYNALEGMDINVFSLREQYLFRHTVVNVLCNVDMECMSFSFENKVASIQDQMRQILVDIVTYIRGNNNSKDNNDSKVSGREPTREYTQDDQKGSSRSVASCESSGQHSSGSPVTVFQRQPRALVR